MKRNNSEPARLPTIQKQRENLRSAVQAAAPPRYGNRNGYEEQKNPGKYYKPDTSKQNYRKKYNPANEDKENRSALIQAGKYALPSARGVPAKPMDVYSRNNPRYNNGAPSSRLSRQR